MEEPIRNSRALREALLQDTHRPRYHIVAPEGVCAPFDPNGALYWNGRYHLMYIVQTDEGHRTTVFEVRLKAHNPERKLKPRMQAEVEFETK